MTKCCKLCQQIKDASEFSLEKRSPSGLNARCKACVCAASAQWRIDNAERRDAYNAKYRAENRDAINEWRKEQRQRDPEHVHALEKRNCVLHADALAKRKRVYYLRNTDRLIEQNRQRNTAVRATQPLNGHHTNAEWLALLARHNGCCVACGSTQRICRDHIVPLSSGGSDLIDNIQPLCRSCNSSKGSKTDWTGREAQWAS